MKIPTRKNSTQSQTKELKERYALKTKYKEPKHEYRTLTYTKLKKKKNCVLTLSKTVLWPLKYK